jgi:predicted NACHT family NTPase
MAIALGIAYEAVVFGFGFVTKIWERLQSKWVDALADWTDAKIRGLLSNFEHRYLRQLVFKHRTFDVKGLTTQSIHALEIEQVFVELAVAPQAAHTSSADPILNVRPDPGDSPRTIWEYFRTEKIGTHNLAILGAPGSGKTTLLKHVALALAGSSRKRLLKATPILIFLRDHSDLIKANPDASLAQVIRDSLTKMGCPPPAGWPERRLEDGKFLVMMDGLDEVADANTRRLVVSWVDRQIENNGNNRFLVTSRPFGYRDNPLSAVTVLVVRPFNSDQVRQFVHNWYLANEIMSAQKTDAGVQMAAAEGAEDLLRRLRNTPALSDLAVNPLLLTMITTVHRYRSSLPGRRVELYAEICDVFLGKRQQARGLSLDLTPAQKKQVLAPLALQMMRDRHREITLSEAAKAIADSLVECQPADRRRGFFADGRELQWSAARARDWSLQFCSSYYSGISRGRSYSHAPA